MVTIFTEHTRSRNMKVPCRGNHKTLVFPSCIGYIVKGSYIFLLQATVNESKLMYIYNYLHVDLLHFYHSDLSHYSCIFAVIFIWICEKMQINRILVCHNIYVVLSKAAHEYRLF